LHGQVARPGVAFGFLVLRRFRGRQAAQIRGDGAVVGSGVGVDLGGQFKPKGVRRVTLGAVHVGQNARVIGGVYGHRDAAFGRAMVLCRGTQHGRASDIDVFDGVGKGAARLGDGFAKGVQVDDQQVDTVYAV